MSYYIVLLIGFVVSLVGVLALMPFYINILKAHKLNQETSEYALEEYKNKSKTPIMGGLLFVLIPLVAFVCCNNFFFKDSKALMVIVSFILFCAVGFLDDMFIVVRKDNNGLTPSSKLVMEFVFTIIIFFVFRSIIDTSLHIPFINISINLSWFYLLFMIVMYLSEANAVNFTDGMDGLCAGVSFIGLIAFVILAYLKKEYNIVLLIICIMGGLLGYLYYNRFPAKIFMGDSGSIALGGLFSALAVVLNLEIALIFIGGIFVWEMLCVVIQQLSVRIFHKRVFSYTPIHYAFVIKGKKETKVVLMFYIIAFIFMFVGLFVGLH